ncbi:MAG TPA: cupin domain-containing protein [Bryobacterales bacterium]|jgi:mannose-6-phosphate isomerase-like protein (cupin superfamily)|nr:cupin domain-containing protein [Bryobacterales bacterium]
MRYFLLLTAVLVTPALVSAAEGSSTPATYISADKVTAGFGKGGFLARTDEYNVQTSRRVKPGNPEVHLKDTEIMYIVNGSATLVTGGALVDGKTTRPEQMVGTSVNGGTSQKISKGDVIVVPAGTPHWFQEVNGTVDYYTVKVHSSK